MSYKKILLTIFTVVIVFIIVISSFTNVKAAKGENLTDNTLVTTPIVCVETVDVKNKTDFIRVITPEIKNTIFAQKNENIDEYKKETPKESNKKLYELVDLWNFKPSHNLVVTHALVQLGADKTVFVEWYENNINDVVINNNWSMPFLFWCVEQATAENFIPMVFDLEELIEFFKKEERFYPNGHNYRPQVGDLLLIDDDGDNIADRINLVSSYDSGTATIHTVGGNVWSEEKSQHIVGEEQYTFGTKKIVGTCNPYYGITQDTTFSDPEIIFNGVDTVAYLHKPEYAKILAENGIEVIARYINPEGRYPLDIEEAQRYSDAGVRIMMIYQINTSDPYKGYDTGYLFGSRALEYARNLQATKGTPIFFCCDCSCDFENFDKVAQFILGVKDAMQGEYGVGLYGGYFVNEAMYNLGLIDAHWQSYGFNRGYLSPNMDMFQSSGSTYFFEEIPLPFDSNYVKNPEKVSYIMPKSKDTNNLT